MNTYIFDLGNVLFKYDPYELCLPYVDDKNEQDIIVNTLFNRKYWNHLDDGSYSDEQYRILMKDIIPPHLYDKAMMIFASWQNKIPEIPGMREIVLSLKKRGDKVYVLSNISSSFGLTYRNNQTVYPLLSLFDDVVISGLIKMMKPNLDIYRYIIKKHNIDVSHCYFIDDKLPNIIAAREVGINALQFDGDINKVKDFFNL